MRLDDQQRLGFTSCHICIHAGRKGVISPQNYLGPRGAPSTLLDPRVWEVFITGAEEQPQNGLLTWDVCGKHHKLLYTIWEQTAQDQVDLARAFDSWIDRIENGEDLFG